MLGTMPRLSLISYLNTAPFRFGLKRLGHAPWTEALPSRMLPLVQSGEVEAAIMPAFDVLSHPAVVALPGTGIAVASVAYSVKLFHRVPLRFAETVALDPSSHTSAALTRIVLETTKRPGFVATPISHRCGSGRRGAAHRRSVPPGTPPACWFRLGEWHRITGLPSSAPGGWQGDVGLRRCCRRR
jgi:hypothetical protein